MPHVLAQARLVGFAKDEDGCRILLYQGEDEDAEVVWIGTDTQREELFRVVMTHAQVCGVIDRALEALEHAVCDHS